MCLSNPPVYIWRIFENPEVSSPCVYPTHQYTFGESLTFLLYRRFFLTHQHRFGQSLTILMCHHPMFIQPPQYRLGNIWESLCVITMFLSNSLTIDLVNRWQSLCVITIWLSNPPSWLTEILKSLVLGLFPYSFIPANQNREGKAPCDVLRWSCTSEARDVWPAYGM